MTNPSRSCLSQLPRIKHLLAPLFVCLALFGCKVDVAPIQAVHFADALAPVDAPPHTVLSAQQLRPLSEWFEENRTGWKSETTSLRPAGIWILVTTKNGEVARFLFNQDEIRTGRLVKRLTSASRTALETVIAPEHRLPAFNESPYPVAPSGPRSKG